MNAKGRNLNKTHRRHHHDEGDPKFQDEYSNRSLFLSRIPPKSTNLSKLIDHYKRFGHIDAIYSSGTHTSIIFESEEATKAAFESPSTVLHNRFIHVSLQKPTVPNMANLASVCNMDIIQKAIQDFNIESQKEAEETEEIRNNLKKKADLRKIEQAKKFMENCKKEKDKLVQEMQTIVNNLENLPDEEKEAKRARLSSLIDMISISQDKIDQIDKLIQDANNINNDDINNTENPS